MQLSTLPHFERRATAGSPHAAAWLRSIKVFKAPQDIATLVLVTGAYWFFSAIVWPDLMLFLVGSLHQSLLLQTLFTSLAIVGVFVVVNEPANALVTSSRPALTLAGSAVSGVLTLTAVCYWLSPHVAAALAAVATAEPFYTPAFIAGNCFLMVANIILPMLGGAFLAGFLRRTMSRPRKLL